jgi:hypothetical protein
VCDISGLPILNKQFYLFADGSCYLLQPLFNKIKLLLTEEERIKAQSLITQILNLGMRLILDSSSYSFLLLNDLTIIWLLLSNS